MDDFKANRIRQLKASIAKSEPLFILRQLGCTHKAIASKTGIHESKVSQALASRSEKIAQLDMYDAQCARHDLSWPYD